jgi:predicted phosphodiesterase
MKSIWIILTLVLIPFLLIGQPVSIYDIQYTTSPGNGTYPSPYEGQVITTGGIVTATGFDNENYFISSSMGGAWNGIFIYDDDYSPNLGDSIVLTGEVYEYNGLTEIKNLISLSVISSGNPLPQPTQLSTNMVYSDEAFESVFIQINNIHVTQTYDEWGEWRVDDGSGSCVISYLIYDLQQAGFPLLEDYPLNVIRGVITYSWGGFRLHPRFDSDIQSTPESHILMIPDLSIYSQDEFLLPVKISILNQPSVISSYVLNIQYNESILEFNGFTTEGTLSQSGLVEDLSSPGNIILQYEGNFNYSGLETLIRLKFLPLNTGTCNVGFIEASINDNPVQFITSGDVEVYFSGNAIGDTLSVIQRPIQNIPEIVVPGELFEIICMAPQNTSNWQLSLQHENIEVPLEIMNMEYNSQLERWSIDAMVPEVSIFELYDLKVIASNEIWDVTKNAIKVIPEEKETFYFVHITDLHLPTNYYYEDPESVYDTSEMTDFREVINDINLINPEFVLLTGDLLNEGELEDFENRRHHTKAQRILGELEVPVFMVPGNHDLGGWNDTPPPQGTARNEWWRFFGWPWLKNGSYYTQDYSFEYGQVHFTGLESYVNYDGYLFNIYGDESFVPSQLEWLELELLFAPQGYAKVLFYHMDFADQLNLAQMDVDMALYGHIHHNEGSIYSTPYNLATDNVCANDRAYRIIKVDNGILQPLNTVSAGVTGNKLKISFEPSNLGESDTVVATISNMHAYDFENGLIKFVMPKGNFNYQVQNGDLLQIDSSGNHAVCYVNANIPSNDELMVSIVGDPVSVIPEPSKNSGIKVYEPFPNPFYNEITFSLWIENPTHIKVEIFDVSGKPIKVLAQEKMMGGFRSFKWDGKDDKGKNISNKVLICRISAEDGFSEVIRVIKM